MKKNRSQSGQIVLITLLVLTIATTVALSLIARTTTDTTITAQVEESSRAFSAAEAGIEQSLKSGVGASGIVGAANVSYNVTVNSIGGATGTYVFPKKTLKGETETLWLAPHTDTGAIDETSIDRYKANSIDVCWSQETDVPAVAVTVLYKKQSTGAYEVVKAAFDPAARPNNFSSAYTIDDCGGNTGTHYKETINFTALNPTLNPADDYLIALRIRPLYSDTKIAINSGVSLLPKQGNQIESTGSTTTGTNRKIVVVQQYRAASSIFDSVLYSTQGNVSKQP